MEEQKRRGRKLGKKTLNMCYLLKVDTNVFRGSKLRKECYYRTKQLLLEGIGYTTKYSEKTGLKVKLGKSWYPSKNVYLKYKNSDKRIPPFNTCVRCDPRTGHIDARNSFTDFILDYVNGSITFKKLSTILTKMNPVVAPKEE